ncbi:MAG: peptidoglycan editing factor PgeF [Gammaproteobacteria bacterium]
MNTIWIEPDWEALPAVRALVTTRAGGVSRGSYASLNLGTRTGDDPAHVAANRARLAATERLPAEPLWLRQVHGNRVLAADEEFKSEPEADAAVTSTPGRVLAVLTADCLSVFLAARDGSAVGVAHAGWRGLAVGVVEATLAAMPVPRDEIIAWLGPAISAAHYEVGADVHDAFADSPGVERAFTASARPGHWFCDLAVLTRARLEAAGVGAVSGGEFCTFDERERFYSYRRDGETGRMASLIWVEPDNAGNDA